MEKADEKISFNKTKVQSPFQGKTLLTNFLRRHHQDFTIEVIGEHQNNPTKHGWDGNY
jgi:hypothetical protein